MRDDESLSVPSCGMEYEKCKVKYGLSVLTSRSGDFKFTCAVGQVGGFYMGDNDVSIKTVHMWPV